MPVPLKVVRAYLLAQTAITTITSTRITSEMPQTFPGIRITEISTVEPTPRRWARSLVQFDCWHTTQENADILARTVAAALRESANYETTGAVMGETDDVAIRSEPDATLHPRQPRAIVTAHIWVRPNP